MAAAGGIDTNRTMAYQAFTYLISLLLVSFAWGPFFRARIFARRILPKYGSVDQPLTYRLIFENRSSRAEKGLAVVEDMVELVPSFEEFDRHPHHYEEQEPSNGSGKMNGFRKLLWLITANRGAAKAKDQPLADLPPHGSEEVLSTLTPLRRGRICFAGLTLLRPDPFGLFKSHLTLAVPQTLLVLPKRYPLPRIERLGIAGRRKYQPGGVALASSVGLSDEFVAVRDYRPGDPLRHIHWKSWAKTGRPIVKEHEDEYFVRHALVLDTFVSLTDPFMFEEAVSVAASFVCTIPRQESLLDLMFVGAQSYCFTSGRGLGGSDQMLEILASVKPGNNGVNGSFTMLQAAVMQRVLVISSCICVFLGWDDERRNFLRELHRRNVPTLTLIITEGTSDFVPEPGPFGVVHRLRAGKIEEDLSRL